MYNVKEKRRLLKMRLMRVNLLHVGDFRALTLKQYLNKIKAELRAFNKSVVGTFKDLTLENKRQAYPCEVSIIVLKFLTL